MNTTAVAAMPRPRTIHDFFGLPQALFEVQYLDADCPTDRADARPPASGPDPGVLPAEDTKL